MIVSTKYPTPADDGKKVVFSGIIRYLVDRYGADSVMYVAVNDRQYVADLPCRVAFVRPPTVYEQSISAFGLILKRSGKSLQEVITYSSRISRELHFMIQEAAPRVLMLDTIRIGQYIKQSNPRLAKRTILYMDHLLYLRFEAMSRYIISFPMAELNPAGTFRRLIPPMARKLLDLRIIQKYIFDFEAIRVKRREVDAVAHFDKCLLLTDSDTAELQRQTGAGHIVTIKPLLMGMPGRLSREFDGAPRFVFFGSLRHPANRSALVEFFRQAMPSVVRELPNAEILVIGAGVDDHLRTLAKPFEKHVRFEGFIENVSDIFVSACALIIPLLFGYGIKIKTITAMHYGLPIISTSEGVRGLSLIADKDFLLENELKNFPKAMKRLCDPVLNTQLSERMIDRFNADFSESAVYKDYDAVF